MLRLLLIALLVAMVPALSVQAQMTSAWETILYVESGEPGAYSGELVTLTPSGISHTTAVPASLFAGAPNGFTSVAVSPDRQLAAFAAMSGGPDGVPAVSIMNLVTGACCVTVSPGVPAVQAYALAGFSPDSTQLAISYVSYVSGEGSGFGGGMMTVDVATGQVVAQVAIDQIRSTTASQDWVAFAQPGPWTGAGVYFVPSCYACEGIFESPWYVWNPATNTIAQTVDEFFSIFGDTLAETGEMIYTIQNPALPVGEQSGMLLPANVVEYYAEGVPLTADERQRGAEAPVVYFNPANLDLPFARWVLDGNAIVIPASARFPQGTVVYRDGATETIPYRTDDAFLTGTTDGFLTQNLATGDITYHRRADAAWTQIVLEQVPGPARVVEAPRLGTAVTQPFTLLSVTTQATTGEPPLAPQQEALTAESCPGFLPSRLSPGSYGIVTPGSANRLRAEPSRDAAIVGQIPGGSAFLVLAGPSCDPAGIAWWQVDYNGTVGWTAEGQGQQYFVVPSGS